MGLPIIGTALKILGGGPLVGEIVKFDKDAQRSFARAAGLAMIILSSGITFILAVLGLTIIKLVF